MQLSNATVASFADGVLTLTFAQAGTEKGFLTGGYDKDLSHVLSALYGITPHIRTAVAIGDPAKHSDNAMRPPGPAPVPRPGSTAEPRVGDVEHPPRASDQGSGRPVRSRSRPPERSGFPAGGVPSGADAEAEPGDLAAPEALTGTDLIERELGGRVIEEIEGS
jgi:hypothetical protein